MQSFKENKIIIICITLSIISFNLGKLSTNKTINENPIIFDVNNQFLDINGGVVASKNSKYYHLPYCPGASRIKESNKIYFDTKDQALSKGLIPARNCKGI